MNPVLNQILYPEITPYETAFLPVDDLHTIYFEQSGNPEGKPVLFLHGGPGGGSDPLYRRYFDPAIYRIIMLDQRGCGKSTPHTELKRNTTWHLVEDLEHLRTHLNIDRWQVFGGSWGSTLSLAYAETYPERVTELVLRGIFLVRDEELRWFYQDGASHIFPQEFAAYQAIIPEEERHDMIGAYERQLQDPSPRIHLEAARAWTTWEKSLSTLLPEDELEKKAEDDHFALAFARIENHYFSNKGFLEPNQLLNNAHRLAEIPTIIIQGRYDMVCPMRSAWELHQALPHSELIIVPDAGHSGLELGIAKALKYAADIFAKA